MINNFEFEEYFEQINTNKDYMDLFNTYIRENLRISPDETKIVLEKIVELAKIQNNEVVCGWSYLYLGWYYYDNSDYLKAIKYHGEASEVFAQYDIFEGITKSYNGLLSDYTAIGIFDLAIEYGLNGTQIAEENEDKDSLALLIINTSEAYIRIKYYKEAKKLLNRLCNIDIELSDLNKVNIYSIFAQIELNEENINNAVDYCDKAIKLIKVIKNNFHRAEILYIRAEVNTKLGNLEKAEIDYNESMIYAIKFGDSKTIIRILISWAKYCSMLGKYNDAIDKLNRAVKESYKIHSSLLKKEIYYELSLVYNYMGRYKDAYEAIVEYNKYEKEIFNNGSSMWLARLNSKNIIEEAKIYKILYEQVNTISKIGKRITSNLKKESTLENIYFEINKLVEANDFGIALYKEEKKILDYEYFIENGKRISYGEIHTDDILSFGTKCFNNKENIIIGDVRKEYDMYLPKEYFDIFIKNNYKSQSLIFCPLMVEDRVIGVITVQSYRKYAYSNNDLKMIEFLSSYIAIALENSKLFHEVEYLARYDSLTNILNRREIIKLGEKHFENSKINNECELGVVMLDIDYFKNINDNYGHHIGDNVLKEVSNLIKSQLRDKDFIGRYGGEEFLIVIQDGNESTVRDICEKIRKSIEEQKFINNNKEHIKATISAGFCILNNESRTFFEGIKDADKALYKAKELGRNRVIQHKFSMN